MFQLCNTNAIFQFCTLLLLISERRLAQNVTFYTVIPIWLPQCMWDCWESHSQSFIQSKTQQWSLFIQWLPKPGVNMKPMYCITNAYTFLQCCHKSGRTAVPWLTFEKSISIFWPWWQHLLSPPAGLQGGVWQDVTTGVGWVTPRWASLSVASEVTSSLPRWCHHHMHSDLTCRSLVGVYVLQCLLHLYMYW